MLGEENNSSGFVVCCLHPMGQSKGMGHFTPKGKERYRKEEKKVRQKEKEEYLSIGEDGRPYIKWRRTKTSGRNKKKAEEMCRTEGEGEEYLL